jgi:protein-S-isoprenylcysteine O-methyltransferase Ste14
MELRDMALAVVVGAAYVRVVAVLIGVVRSLAARAHARAARFGLVEALASFEVVVLAAVAYPCYRAAVDSPNSSIRTAAALVGAVLAVVYLALLVAVLASWRGVHTGAIVVEGQQLVTGGIYGIIRHPLYTGAFVLWVGVAVANLSLPAAGVFLFFVVPTYLLYIEREERMLKSAFGDAYQQYCATVPRLLPTRGLHAGSHRIE